MRLVKLRVPDEKIDAALSVLDDENVDFAVTKDAYEDEASFVEFPLPTQAVEYVLNELRDRGLDDGEYTIISSAESAKTRNFSELEDRFVAGVEEDDSVAPEEIRGKALGMHRGAVTYYSLTILSAIVAASGLLLDSPAIVVGAMVIAPQVGSALITSVGMVINDRRMILIGLKTQVVGLSTAVVSAFAFSWLVRSTQFVSPLLSVASVSQVGNRISPGIMTLAVAFCAGGAAAFGLATALPVSLVGVMIAAALIPAAAAVGIGVAWGLPSVALGATLLLVVNAVAINLAAFAVLWCLGYRPDGWNGRPPDAERVRTFGAALVALVLLVATFAGAGYALSQQVAYERQTNEAVENVLQEERYAALELQRIQVGVDSVGPLEMAQEVTIVVSRPAGEAYPGLAAEMARAIESHSGKPVTVEVEFRDRQRALSSGDGSTSAAAIRPDAPRRRSGIDDGAVAS